MNIRRHVQHVNNGNVLRNGNEVLVRTVNTPPLFYFQANTYQVQCMSPEHIYMRHMKAQEV